MGAFAAIRRWWRGKGHGIHSPFAYRFVTDVLHSPHAYYSYPLIDAESGSAAQRDDSRRVFRIILASRPIAVDRSGILSAAIETAIAEGCKGFRIASSARMAVVGAGCGKASTAAECVADGGTAIFTDLTDPDVAVTLATTRAAMSRGMIFAGRRMAVAVGLPHLPRQDFEIDI